MVTDPGRPLRRDAQHNLQRILAAASEVFAEERLAASLDRIAERAGVASGTFYRRFSNKNELVDALFETRIHEIAALAEAARAADDPWEGLLGFLGQLVTRLASDRGLKEALLLRDRDRASGARDAVHASVGRLLDRAKECGCARVDLAVGDLTLIVLMVTDTADLTRDRGPELWRRMLQLVIDGMVQARVVPTPLPAVAAEVPSV
jgi:AcrR family transcriptional regulator